MSNKANSSRFFHGSQQVEIIIIIVLSVVANAVYCTLSLQSGQFSEDMIPTVGFNMRKVTKGNVTIKVSKHFLSMPCHVMLSVLESTFVLCSWEDALLSQWTSVQSTRLGSGVKRQPYWPIGLYFSCKQTELLLI